MRDSGSFGDAAGALRFELRSVLPGADLAEVRSAVVSWEGVNAELAPIAMGHPAACARIDDVPADGRVHFTSVVTCFGIPFDRHRLAFVELKARSHFQEVSSNLLLREWTHRRSLASLEDGVVVTDLCTLRARWSPLAPMLLKIYRRIFERRHARLRARFAPPP